LWVAIDPIIQEGSAMTSRLSFAALLALAALAAPAAAQSSAAPAAKPAAAPAFTTGVSDRFQIDTGYFRITANTVLRFNGPQGAGDVDFEKDLGINKDANTLWLDATWRVGRRHQLKLSYTKLNRDRADVVLQRDFTWGGETYTAGLTADTSTGTDILAGYYRFAAYRNDRFEIGPTVGVGYLWLSARVRATGSVAGASRSLDESASTGSITGAVGGYFSAWPAKRLSLRGDYLYIKVTPGNTEASIHDWRIGANYYFLRNVGVGAQYKYYSYSYDRGVLVSQLGGKITYQGFQVFASFAF
jgi:opacity protein-like surface antigen